MSNHHHTTAGSSLARSPNPNSRRAPDSPHRLARNTPPPPKLNLEDYRPIISTTATNTSNNAALRPSSAFVFTSSRTLRTLHNLPVALESEPSPPADVTPPSPASTSSNPTVTASTRKQRTKPTLSPLQLARHSQGAVDARCIVSSNMRAAGFVPLTHSPPSSGCSSAPSVASVPTPKDPPNFPPVVFFNASHVARTPMWEYQRNLQYGLGKPPSSYESALEPDNKADRPTFSSNANLLASLGSQNVRPTMSQATSFSSVGSCESSLFSSVSASSSLTSFTSSTITPLHQQFSESVSLSGSPTVNDGYPFPRAPDLRSEWSPMSSVQHVSHANVIASPTMSRSTVSRSVTPVAQSQPSSPEPLNPPTLQASSSSGTSSPRSQASSVLPPTPSFTSKLNPRPSQQAQLSITELCTSSPFAWYNRPVILPPVTDVPMRRDASVTTTTRSTPSNRRSIVREVSTRSVVSEGTLGRRKVAEVKVKKIDEEYGEGVAVFAVTKASNVKDTLLVAMQAAEKDSSGSEKSGYRGRQRDRERDREKEREKKQEWRRLKDKMQEVAADELAHSPTSSRSSKSTQMRHSPPSAKNDKGQERDRTRSSGQKSLAVSHAHSHAYSSFTFPPQSVDRRRVAQAHVLGHRDIALEREREREAAEFAKDQVFAHREMDRRHARLTEQRAMEKDMRDQHKKRALMPPVQSFAATSYAAASGQGRGRGRGRGEQPSGRGRSVSTASMSSVFSEGETMVCDTDSPARFESIAEA